MKKVFAMFTMVAVLGCTVVGCGDNAEKDKKKVDSKVNADKSTTTKEEKKSTTAPSKD